MIGDNTLYNVFEKIGGCRIIEQEATLVSDNDILVKIVPIKSKVYFKDISIDVGKAKVFSPNLRVDLNNKSVGEGNLFNTFTEDMNNSEFNNPSLVEGKNGSFGYDFWINYNGNITTWGNQQLDEILNLYEDDYQTIINSTMDNILSYSFLDKGYDYRRKIILKVNEKAVLRAECVNIRDYAGALMLEESKSRLFLCIMIIRDYIKEEIISKQQLKKLSKSIVNLFLKYSDEEIIYLYKQSNYSIIDDYYRCEFDENSWINLFYLISMGHYDVKEEKLIEGLNYFNKKTGQHIQALCDIMQEPDNEQYAKLIKRITFMKPSVVKKLQTTL